MKKLSPVEEQRRRANRNRRRDRQLVEAAYRDASKAIADQTVVHHRETAALATNYVVMQGALRGAVNLLDKLRGGWQWLPVDTHELEKWRELAK